MKKLSNINKVMTLMCSLVFIICLSSCTQHEEANISANNVTQKNVQDVLAQMKSLGDSQGKIIAFEVKNISKVNYQQYFEVIKNSKKVLDFASSADSSLRKGPGDNYTVTCTWGNGETTVTECGENVGCAGSATWDCLENGGCATICNAKITYIPANIKKEKVTKKEAIKSILEQVIKISESKGEAVSFSIANNKDKYWLNDISKIKNDSDNNLLAKAERTFQVDCYDSDGELMWQDTYYDKLSASQGILDCTDRDGGCAEICEIYAKYIPASKSK